MNQPLQHMRSFLEKFLMEVDLQTLEKNKIIQIGSDLKQFYGGITEAENNMFSDLEILPDKVNTFLQKNRELLQKGASVVTMVKIIPSKVIKEQEKQSKKRSAEELDGFRKKKIKNKEVPKRAKNAFMIFSHQKRAFVKKTYPKAEVSEIAKILGDLWKNLRPEEKVPFVKLQQEDKARYEQEKKLYDATKRDIESNGVPATSSYVTTKLEKKVVAPYTNDKKKKLFLKNSQETPLTLVYFNTG